MSNLEKMSLPELQAERVATMQEMNDLDEALSHIKSQIAEAKARAADSGEYVDRGWFRRIEDAKRIKGRQRVALQNDLGDLNREIKKREHEASRREKDQWAWEFVAVVRRAAGPEKFEEYRRAADIAFALGDQVSPEQRGKDG